MRKPTSLVHYTLVGLMAVTGLAGSAHATKRRSARFVQALHRSALIATPFKTIAKLTPAPTQKPAPADQLPLGQALSSFALATQPISRNDGSGDVYYWIKNASDTARFGRAMGKALFLLAREATPASRPLVLSISGRLAAMDTPGSGHADYWLSRTESLRTDLRWAGQQLQSLAGLTDPVSTGRTLKLVAGMIIDGNSAEGSGDLDYWIRSTRNQARIANGAGATVGALALHLPENQRPLMQTYASQLQQISDQGYGDQDYWAARTAEVVQSARSTATAIFQATDAPPALAKLKVAKVAFKK